MNTRHTPPLSSSNAARTRRYITQVAVTSEHSSGPMGCLLACQTSLGGQA